MPLGLMPGMSYEEREATLEPGASVLLYSDGLVEAHDADREMFGTAARAELLARGRHPQAQLDRPPARALDGFTGDGRGAGGRHHARRARAPERRRRAWCPCSSSAAERRRATSATRCAASPRRSAAAGLAPARLERLKTATAEATMNAMEHGNRFDADPSWSTSSSLASDYDADGADHRPGRRPRDRAEAETPDIDAKLDGAPVAARLGPVPDRAAWSTRCAQTSDEHAPHARARHAPGRRRDDEPDRA